MVQTLNVEFGAITSDNVEQLRKVNLACFPVQYQESYYNDVVERNNVGLCKFAYWKGFVVGAACARLETIDTGSSSSTSNTTSSSPSTENMNNNNNSNNNHTNSNNNNNNENGGKRQRLYIMTLGVLAAYRGRTIGTQLIQSILDHYEDHKDNELCNVEEISLHVQISNEDAIKFYTTRFGFIQGEMVENYYRRIDPPHCYRLYKKLR